MTEFSPDDYMFQIEALASNMVCLLGVSYEEAKARILSQILESFKEEAPEWAEKIWGNQP